jgi:hypothetical protein
MSERKASGLPFDSKDPAEKAIWSALSDLPEESPSTNLRRGFYRKLDNASSESWLNKLREGLGFGSNTGWLTAAACVLLGFGIGSVEDGALSGGSQGSDTERLALLEDNVELLNRELIIARLEDADSGKRLKGVFDARATVRTDQQIAQALLVRATVDRVPSIRSAAIDVLGANLTNTGVGAELMHLLAQSESPTVQLALVDVVLRYGTREQLEQLLSLAEAGLLHPDIIRHVMNALGSNKA